MSEARGIMASVVLASAATAAAGVLVISLLPERVNTLLMKGTVLCAAGYAIVYYLKKLLIPPKYYVEYDLYKEVSKRFVRDPTSYLSVLPPELWEKVVAYGRAHGARRYVREERRRTHRENMRIMRKEWSSVSRATLVAAITGAVLLGLLLARGIHKAGVGVWLLVRRLWT